MMGDKCPCGVCLELEVLVSSRWCVAIAPSSSSPQAALHEEVAQEERENEPGHRRPQRPNRRLAAIRRHNSAKVPSLQQATEPTMQKQYSIVFDSMGLSCASLYSIDLDNMGLSFSSLPFGVSRTPSKRQGIRTSCPSSTEMREMLLLLEKEVRPLDMLEEVERDQPRVKINKSCSNLFEHSSHERNEKPRMQRRCSVTKCSLEEMDQVRQEDSCLEKPSTTMNNKSCSDLFEHSSPHELNERPRMQRRCSVTKYSLEEMDQVRQEDSCLEKPSTMNNKSCTDLFDVPAPQRNERPRMQRRCSVTKYSLEEMDQVRQEDSCLETFNTINKDGDDSDDDKMKEPVPTPPRPTRSLMKLWGSVTNIFADDTKESEQQRFVATLPIASRKAEITKRTRVARAG
jgi:hypothetical protein